MTMKDEGVRMVQGFVWKCWNVVHGCRSNRFTKFIDYGRCFKDAKALSRDKYGRILKFLISVADKLWKSQLQLS